MVDSRIYLLHTALDLAVPMPRFPVVESDYGIALEKELKEARVVTKKNIEAAHDIRRVNMIEKSRTMRGSCEAKIDSETRRVGESYKLPTLERVDLVQVTRF